MNIPSGIYDIHVRSSNQCAPVIKKHLHLTIPKFFTPNGDTINDTFVLNGMDFFSSYEISIFNRYGNLLKRSQNKALSWDGTFNNTPLPASDYWYTIKVNDTLFKGHFALKR